MSGLDFKTTLTRSREDSCEDDAEPLERPPFAFAEKDSFLWASSLPLPLPLPFLAFLASDPLASFWPEVWGLSGLSFPFPFPLALGF